MPDRKEQSQDNFQENFMIEKIKQRPINKRRLIRRTMITASMAIIFGLIACFTFLVLEPVISNWLYPEKEPEAIIFPEEPEEMLPEEMLEEYIQPSPSPSPQPEEAPPEKLELDESQVQEILNRVVLDMGDYRQRTSCPGPRRRWSRRSRRPRPWRCRRSARRWRSSRRRTGRQSRRRGRYSRSYPRSCGQCGGCPRSTWWRSRP